MKRVKKVLLLGSGALKIGEAGEFDYSGTQAIKALKEEGVEVILVNPNIATIQTSQGLADKNYFLPVTPEFVSRVIEKEKPEGILLSFGGQTALNCGMALYKQQVLQKNNVAVLGTTVQTIIETEDRELFAKRLAQINLKTPKGKIIKSVDEALAFVTKIGLPVMVRVGFALGGAGSGVIHTKLELQKRLKELLRIHEQIIIEECVSGWKEIEYEVVRDKLDNCITVCNMENLDPMGIHTGESIVVAPSQTLNNYEYYFLRDIAISVIRQLKIIGECNIQYALNPKTGDYRIIEVNARLSRSSALASKATGYPLAYVAAKLALGKTLPQLPNSVTKKTTAFFEPALDYVVVKIPRWDIDKFTNADTKVGSEMKSVGEVMSIARSFEEAIQKGARMLNDGYEGVIDKNFDNQTRAQLLKRLKTPDTMRLFTFASALRAGITVEKIHELTQIDPWFLTKLKNIVDMYHLLYRHKKVSIETLKEAKMLGFSDKQIGDIIGSSADAIRLRRKKAAIIPQVKSIDTLAGEFPAQTNYLYVTYSGSKSDHTPNKNTKKIIVLGGGPYAIGSSVEFDWCAVTTVATLRKHGFLGIMVNCNPETVSTDFDHSDYLYFEELSLERVLDIYDIEKSAFILSMGGQIPNTLSQQLPKYGISILGTKPKNIGIAENRAEFSRLLDRLKIKQPAWGRAHSAKEARKMARTFGYPLLIRPSFVLSGKAMRVLQTEKELLPYLSHIDLDIKEHPLLITQFLNGASECDYDGVANRGTVILSALSEHIESAGVHSGDSTLILPPVSLAQSTQQKINAIAQKIISALVVSGPCNIQFLIRNDEVYVIECNLRASRSFPFVSKILQVNFIEAATQIMLGKKTAITTFSTPAYVGVKVPQFSYHKLKGADPVLKVEMNSTGEVAAIGNDVHRAYLKAMLSTGVKYPSKKAVLVSLGGMESKMSMLFPLRQLLEQRFMIYSTTGTAFFMKENGITTTIVGKIFENIHPTAGELIENKLIDFAVIIPNNPYTGANSAKLKRNLSDGYHLRRKAIDFGIPVFSNLESATYFIEAVTKYAPKDLQIKLMNEYTL